jgi:antitoxin MazE
LYIHRFDIPYLVGYTLDIHRRLQMVTKIQRWGNSQGLRITRQMLEDAHISVGDEVDVAVRDGLIMIAPVRPVRGKHSLKELVSRIPKNYRTEELDWGDPVGREAW